MDLEKLKMIKTELEKEFNDNELKIENLENRLKILGVNKFENKFLNSVAFSLLPYNIFLFLIQFMWIKNGLIPTYLTLYLHAGISGLIGVISEKCLEKKRNLKDKIEKNFGSNKIEDVLECEIKEQIERDKLLNKNKILKEVYEKLCLRENLFEIILEDFDIYSKSNNEKGIGYSLVSNKEVELNDLITKKVLFENRDLVSYKLDIFKDVLLSGFSLLLFVHFPAVLFGISGIPFNGTIFQLLCNFLLTFGVGSLTTLVYKINNNNNIKRYIDKVSNDNLCKELDIDDVCDYEEKIEKLIKEISDLKIELITDEAKISNKELEKLENKNNFSYSYRPNRDIVNDLNEQVNGVEKSSCLTRKKVKMNNNVDN